MGAIGIGVVNGVKGGTRRGAQPAPPRDAFLLDEQLFDRRHRRDLGFEFGELVAQQIEAGVAVLGGRFQRIVVAPAGPVTAVDLGHLARQCRVETLIEQIALRGAFDQVLKFLLAVNFDEEFAELPQLLEGDQLPVDVGARAAVRADHAPHDHFLVVLDVLGVEPGQGGGGQGREAGGDFGALRPLTYDVGGRPAAGNQQQCVHHDGFPGAGLARQRREAGSEVQLGRIHDDQVTELQMREHAIRRCRGRRGPSAVWSGAGGSSRSRADAAA